MNAFEFQKTIIDALIAGKQVECRARIQPLVQPPEGAPWVAVAKDPHRLNFAEHEYRIAPPGAQPVWAVWDSDASLYANQIFHGPAAATQYAISGNAAARSENRFVPVKLQRAPDGP